MRFGWLFCGINLLFLFLLLYQKSKSTALFYERQTLEQQLRSLEEERVSLHRELLLLQEPGHVYTHAINNLGMQPIRLKQVKRITV